jgi:hypothetical protein
MIDHSELGGRCPGKLVKQSIRPVKPGVRKRPEIRYICNVCDALVLQSMIEKRKKLRRDPAK